jgi:hypothetical protein
VGLLVMGLGTLLGPEGTGLVFGFVALSGLALAAVVVGVGVRLFFENCTVDASILLYVWPSF